MQPPYTFSFHPNATEHKNYVSKGKRCHRWRIRRSFATQISSKSFRVKTTSFRHVAFSFVPSFFRDHGKRGRHENFSGKNSFSRELMRDHVMAWVYRVRPPALFSFLRFGRRSGATKSEKANCKFSHSKWDEITDYPCNLIGSKWCDLFTNRTIFCSKSHLFLSQ